MAKRTTAGMPRKRVTSPRAQQPLYEGLVGDIAGLLAAARRASARAVNALMTATYWEIGRRIVEFEQGGAERAAYGEELLKRLSADLRERFGGRGFGVVNLSHMKRFYLGWPSTKIFQTPSEKSAVLDSRGIEAPIRQTASGELSAAEIRSTPLNESQIFQTPNEKSQSLSKVSAHDNALAFLRSIAARFPLSWSHYVLLIRRSRSPEALEFYHSEALRGGWSVRQLQRQVD